MNLESLEPWRPAIGAKCIHAGEKGEVRATFPSPNGIKVVGLYDRPHGDETHFVDLWSACTPLRSVNTDLILEL